MEEVESDALDALERGDRDEALQVLMNGYGSAVYRFCRQMVRNPDLVDDVHQLSFVQAYRDLERFERRSSLRSWLFGIARHRCLDAQRTSKRQQSRFESLHDHPVVEERTESGERVVLRRSLEVAVSDCVSRLAPNARAAVLLRFREGLSYPEMARVFEEKAATLRIRVSRALPALRLCLEELGVTV